MTAAPPASAVQFTTHELLALLALNRGPSEEASRSMLKLADLPEREHHVQLLLRVPRALEQLEQRDGNSSIGRGTRSPLVALPGRWPGS